jgi:chromosome segregation ATPase
MCSERQEEVAAVKSELFKAGIRAEIRQNPVAAALQITRLELWVENEKDYFAAHKLYTNMQARAKNGHEPAAAEAPTESSLAMERLPARSTGSGRVPDLDAKKKSQRPSGELEEARLLLEREIEDVLEREDALSETCGALRRELESLSRSLSESQAAAEKKASEFASLKSSLERELAERTRSEEQLKGELRELQLRLKAGEESLSEKHKRLEATLQQLQTQQAMVVELRKEIVSREQEWEANNRLVSKAHAELVAERESLIASEEKAAKSARALEQLEKQLAEQKDLQAQLRASIGSMNAFRDRLQAKKTSVRA